MTVRSTKSQLKQNNGVNPSASPLGTQPDTKQKKDIDPRKRVTYLRWEVLANLLLGYKADYMSLEQMLEYWFYELDALKAFGSRTNSMRHFDSLKLVIQDYCGINYMVKLGQIKAKKGEHYGKYKMFHLQKSV